MPIRYQIGDATLPLPDTSSVLVHVCNDIGGWGRGFVTAISKRYPEAEKAYRNWHKGSDTTPFLLGQVQFVKIRSNADRPSFWIANLIGQHGIRRKGSTPPIRYEAIREGLATVAAFALEHKAAVQMPRIGCGLAGGTWEEIEPLLQQELLDKGIEVTVYNLPATDKPEE